MTKKLTPKCEKKYYCEICDFGSNNKADYSMHLITNKHKRLKMTKNTNVNSQNLAKNIFMCDCGKVYKHQSSLCKHKLKCIYEKDNNEESTDDMKELIVKIMKDNSEKMDFLMNENKELRSQIKEQNQQITELIPKVGNNNNNLKQKFNISVFLNEKCKDAISMDEFIDKI